MEGVWYEADQRHAEIIVRELALEGNKVKSEMTGEKVTMNEEDEEERAQWGTRGFGFISLPNNAPSSIGKIEAYNRCISLGKSLKPE